jgi:hypothetical protein
MRRDRKGDMREDMRRHRRLSRKGDRIVCRRRDRRED